MQPLLQLAQLVLEAAGDHIEPEIEEVAAEIAQRQARRLADARRLGRHQRGQVDVEVDLQIRVLEDVRHHRFRRGVRLDLDDDAHGVGRFVAHVGGLRQAPADDVRGDLLDDVRLVGGVRHRGDDHPLAALLQRRDVLAAQAHRALTGLVDVAQLAPRVEDLAAGREVRAFDVLAQILVADIRLADHGHERLDDLVQVVRRDVGRHAHRDAGAAVDQQLRDGRRQDDRLTQRGVVVVAEVDRLVADVAQQLLGDRRQARLGVAHGRRAVAVERAEVALALHQRVAQRERLRHAHHGLVRSQVAVRVVFPQAPRRRRPPTCAAARPPVRCRFWYMAYRMRRCTGLRPSRTSGNARDVMTLSAYAR